ncbi:transcriptional regulator, TetR family [Alkaliphilus metalliredigens QYMF]|uniref:Transcriptional regulator, TetR family n=1 Tax=Alkaliphilus metalliredigens (strain QYMF) TaxID=293826 RepID=A6TKV6_ALKMQ|nr:TetR/AcrR family transcriptional regulator [Alkaliphilus metalliredigens]ABR46824.1 transcriptional regulator, TetR family [Alkaliphilus metalliredigens QYMF]
MASQSEIKYNRLVEKAEMLFIQFGYKAVSVDEISEAAGISKMTIYKYFDSKETLFIEVMLLLMDRQYNLIEAKLNDISGTLEKINFMMNYSLEGAKDYSLALYKDIMNIPHITERLIAVKNEKNKVLFESMIREGMEKGEVKRGDVVFMADMIIMMIEAFGQRHFYKINNREDLEGLTKSLFDFLKYGLLGGGA